MSTYNSPDVRKLNVGDIKTTVEQLVEHECLVCEKPAEYQLTFLLPNARTNPDSAAYGKDDASWCSDHSEYACEDHKQVVRSNTESTRKMEWCSTFPRVGYPHLFTQWKHVSVQVASPGDDFWSANVHKAALVAMSAHWNVKDEVDRPSILHIFRVIVSMRTEETQVVAALHRTIEVGRCSVEYLREKFGSNVADAVAVLTQNPRETHERYVTRILEAPERIRQTCVRVALASFSDRLQPEYLDLIRDRNLRDLCENQFQEAISRLQSVLVIEEPR